MTPEEAQRAIVARLGEPEFRIGDVVSPRATPAGDELGVVTDVFIDGPDGYVSVENVVADFVVTSRLGADPTGYLDECAWRYNVVFDLTRVAPGGDLDYDGEARYAGFELTPATLEVAR